MKKMGLIIFLLLTVLLTAFSQAKPPAKAETPAAPAPAKPPALPAQALPSFITVGIENFAPMTGTFGYGYDLGPLMLRGSLSFSYSNEIPPNARHTDTAFGVGLAVLFPFIRGPVEPYLGFGLDLSLGNSVDVLGTTSTENATTEFDIDVPLGVEFKASPNFGIGAESGLKLAFINSMPNNTLANATNTTVLGFLNPGIFLRFHF